MNLSIIIVSFNVREQLRKNLESIFNSNVNFGFEVFVVDNNSVDKSVEMIKKYFPQVRLIENKNNLGFAKANNQILKLIKNKYALLLNPDMKLKNDTLQNIYNWMENNKQVSIAGIKLLGKDGKIIKHVRRFPKFFDQLAIILKIPHIFPQILNKYILNKFNYTKECQVDSIRGGFFMMNLKNLQKLQKVSVLKNLDNTLPFLDERYFIWFEEVDFCKQVYVAGGEVWYTPVAECIDYVGQSFNQVDRKVKQNYFKDSQLKYFKKWHSIWQYFVLKIAWVLGKIITNVLEVFHVKGKGKT